MIQILSTDVINQIAAGEVVERPASVLKEILENAIDAGATNIKVYINEFGTKKIQVIDDGCGIEKGDFDGVFIKHATSKIRKLEDLDDINTFGFRGEALASISSISEVILQTKNDADQIGTELVYKDGKILSEKPSAIAKGTDIQVLNLFENIPARKKFLKSKNTENKVLLEIFNKFALANPKISFSLSIDGVEKKYTAGSPEDRASQILKVPVSDLISIYYDGEIKISGFVIHPKIFMKTRSSQHVFVNNRPVSDPTIYKAVVDGFDTFLMKNQYPGYVIFVNLPAHQVDVNVHPRKTEVRFYNPSDIYRAVRNAVNAGLMRNLKQEVHTKLSKFEEKQDDAGFIPNENIIAEPKKEYKADTDNTFEDFLHQSNPVNKEFESEYLAYKEKLTQTALEFNKEVIDIDVNKESIFLNFANSIQLLNSYIITDNGKDILVIDQHAASERYFYEKYLAQLKNKTVLSKVLLFPEVISLEEYELGVLEENKSLFTDLGFDFESFGSEDIKITKVPEFVKLDNFGHVIHKLIKDILENKELSSVKDKILHEIAAILACHTAVRFGDALTKDEIVKILKDLVTCEDPYNCPHGRPIIQEFSKYDIEKRFRRCGI